MPAFRRIRVVGARLAPLRTLPAWVAAAPAALVTLAACGAWAAAADVPAYEMRIRVEPTAGTIEGRVEIRSPGTSRFVLSRDLAIRRVLADGRPVAFEQSPSSPTATAREVTINGAAPDRLIVEYDGGIRRESYSAMVSQVNMVRPELVELANYVNWYPRLTPFRSFTFRLSVDVPAGFVTVTNGRLDGPETRKGGRSVSRWTFSEPASDVVVVSAPQLRRASSVGGSVSVEAFAGALPQDYVDAITNDVARAAETEARLIGAPLPLGLVRVVYSPRPGWGYVRQPLVVVSEENALAARGQQFGAARDLRYVAHEIAHYWWHFADAGTPDDWINEGLAEYTALLAAGTLAGEAFARRLLDEYRERSENSATTAAIAETTADSPDREVNRYARPVLILDELQQTHGADRMAAFIQALYRRFSSDGSATTAAFLSVAGDRLGPEAKKSLSAALFRKDWRGAPAGPRYVYSPGDARFLGEWTGTLTQAGSKNRVVLHLALQNGNLVATLGSPDQGARDNPVPVVRISGDSLYFGLGAFGVTYRGVLGGDGTALDGEWRQGGVAYPLSLTRR